MHVVCLTCVFCSFSLFLIELFLEQNAALFRCRQCGVEVEVALEDGSIVEPKCRQCNQPNTMMMMYNQSSYCDRQSVVIQETPENIREGQTPQQMLISATDHLVDRCRPGDRVIVTGIYRAVALRSNPRLSYLSVNFHCLVDALYIDVDADASASSAEADSNHRRRPARVRHNDVLMTQAQEDERSVALFLFAWP